MSDCTVTASAGKSELTVVVVDHYHGKLPALVQREADKVGKGTLSAPLNVLTDRGRYLLLKLDSKDWLVGGEDWRMLGKQIAECARAVAAASVSVPLNEEADAQALAEGVLLGDYRYLQCRSGKERKRSKLTVRIPGRSKDVKSGVQAAECQNIAREFCDMPGNELNPAVFVRRARQVLKGLGLEIKVIQGLSALRKAGFPGLVHVGKAGSAEPALLEVRYRPSGGSGKGGGKKQLALVGKGITFDSGGISLKPGSGMWEMKGDMGGAGAMLGAIRLIALRKPKIPVTAYFALAENMPDTNATRPGDIYQARNGRYIHVDNTDAEGRLVLSDTLTYACEQGASHVIDAATLTGAALVGVGSGIAAIMGRHEDFVQQVRGAGQDRGEEFWPLPLYGEYRQQLDHPHADINNTGGRTAGTITAGLFLAEFVDPKVRWVHCDIAGPAMQSGGWRYYAKGMTAFGVRSFAHLAEEL